ncbi:MULTISPECIES: DUF4238 domain-containing protein [unclassified Microbacterium]|uniref:DUF4238 domain-containing protein n=1 Tax=unclassified Microbacterium TaxID=2609290 RepID=UPI003018736D
MPRFLLRSFADERGNLRRFDISGDVTRAGRVNAKIATVVEDFYVIDSLTARYDIEKRENISRLEDGGAKILHRLCAANDLANVWPLSECDRGALCSFLASLVLRTPSFETTRKRSQSSG